MRLAACGDALFSGGNLAARIDPGVRAALAGADAAFANAEFVCPRHTTPPAPRRFMTAVGAEALDELKSLKVNLLSFANNHAGDFGHQGVTDTIEACQSRGLGHSGIGRSLAEARAPQFLDTPQGRIALIAAGTTRAAEFAASPPGSGIPARPGMNPLRWGRAYVLADAEFRELQRIESLLGIADSRREVARVEVVPDPGPDRFAFGSFFEGSLQIERGAAAAVRYFLNEGDAKAILASISDAAARADVVLFSLHTHEGTDENWYSPHAPDMIENFARRAIEAGASAVLGHGPHMLRGVEFHHGRPIFYSLGSLLMEFEAGMQRMTPEMFAAYGFPADALPSHLHASRAKDPAGNWIGFNGDPRFSRSVIALYDFADDATEVRLVPIDLDLQRPRPHDRGLPASASPELGAAIAESMAAMSDRYGTRIAYDGATGTISARPG